MLNAILLKKKGDINILPAFSHYLCNDSKVLKIFHLFYFQCAIFIF